MLAESIYLYIPQDWKPLSLPLKEAIITFRDEPCCEWSKYKGDQKALVSFITHFKRRRKRRWGAVKATTAECIVTVVVSHPMRPEHIA